MTKRLNLDVSLRDRNNLSWNVILSESFLLLRSPGSFRLVNYGDFYRSPATLSTTGVKLSFPEQIRKETKCLKYRVVESIRVHRVWKPTLVTRTWSL